MKRNSGPPGRNIPKPTSEEEMAAIVGYDLIRSDEISHSLAVKQSNSIALESNWTPPESSLQCACPFTGKKCESDACFARASRMACSKDCVDGCGNNPWREEGNWAIGTKTYLYWNQNDGFGIRAMEQLEKGTWICHFTGVVTNKTAKDDNADQDHESKEYVADLDNVKQVINPYFKGNGASVINHSCVANCDALKYSVNGRYAIVIRSNKTIEADEELTFNYGHISATGKTTRECKCGQITCNTDVGAAKDAGKSRISPARLQPEPDPFPMLLYSSDPSVQSVIKKSPVAKTRPEFYKETFVFEPLSQVYFLMTSFDDTEAIKVFSGRVVECFNNLKNQWYYSIFTQEFGPMLLYIPRFLVYRYIEDALANIENGVYSPEDMTRIRTNVPACTDNEMTQAQSEAVANDFEQLFEDGKIPEYKAKSRSFVGGHALGVPNVALVTNGGNLDETLQTENDQDEDSVQNVDPALSLYSKGKSSKAKFDKKQNEKQHHLTVQEVVESYFNVTGLIKLISHAATEVTLIALARFPEDVRPSYLKIYNQVYADLMHWYVEVPPQCRKYLTFQHYLFAIEQHHPGSFQLQWCPCCRMPNNFPHSIQFHRHFLRHHSIVSPCYQCSTCHGNFHLPSQFRQHLNHCQDDVRRGLNPLMADQILDAYSDYAAKKGLNNMEQHIIIPGIPNMRVGNRGCHEKGDYKMEVPPLIMDTIKGVPQGKSNEAYMRPTNFDIQVKYTHFGDWGKLLRNQVPEVAITHQQRQIVYGDMQAKGFFKKDTKRHHRVLTQIQPSRQTTSANDHLVGSSKTFSKSPLSTPTVGFNSTNRKRAAVDGKQALRLPAKRTRMDRNGPKANNNGKRTINDLTKTIELATAYCTPNKKLKKL